MDTKNTKPIKNKAAQALARLKHKKNPNPPEHYVRMGKLGAEKRWAKQRVEALDN